MSQITTRGLGGPSIGLTANGTFQSVTDQNLQTLVGTRWDLNDGREVILVSPSTSTTVAPGYLYQDAAIVADHQGLAVTAFNAYGVSGGVANSASAPASVVVTLGAAAATANQYAGGYLVVATGTGIGQTLRIASNTAGAASGSITVTLEDAPNTALTTSSTVNLVPAHGSNVILQPIVATNSPVGVALYPFAASTSTANNYGFLVSRGTVGAIADATAPAAGVAVGASIATAGTLGAAIANTTTGDLKTSVIGTSSQAQTSADAGAFYVQL